MVIWRMAFPRFKVASLSSPFGPSSPRPPQRRINYYDRC